MTVRRSARSKKVPFVTVLEVGLILAILFLFFGTIILIFAA
ncbi:MAG: hypothetical protein WCT28_00060 [Patescibacteria group bacterium]|jgi:hypothetical protein